MSMRPPASRRVRTPAIALASPAIVQSGPGSLWILPWRGKRARCVRRRLNRRRERVYHTTWTAQTPPTEPTGIVVLALVHEITRTTSMIRCDTDATSLRSPLQQHTPFLRGVSFRCRRGVNSGCRLTRLVRGRPFKDATLVAELHEGVGHWPLSQRQSARAASVRRQRAGPTGNTPRECRQGWKWPTAAARGRGQPAGLGAADLTAVVATCSSATGRCRWTGCASTMGVRSVHRAGEGCRLSVSADWYQD